MQVFVLQLQTPSLTMIATGKRLLTFLKMGCCSTVPRRNWCRQFGYASGGSWRQCYTDAGYFPLFLPFQFYRHAIYLISSTKGGGAPQFGTTGTRRCYYGTPITSRRRSVDSNKIGKGETWERYQHTISESPPYVANNDCSWRTRRAGRTQHVSVGTRSEPQRNK
jgi:hypothetical protein